MTIQLQQNRALTPTELRYLLDPIAIGIGFVLLRWMYDIPDPERTHLAITDENIPIFTPEGISCLLASVPAMWVCGFSKVIGDLDELLPEQITGLHTPEYGQVMDAFCQSPTVGEAQKVWLKNFIEKKGLIQK